jgi:hypothetical protein
MARFTPPSRCCSIERRHRLDMNRRRCTTPLVGNAVTRVDISATAQVTRLIAALSASLAPLRDTLDQ